MFNFSFIKKIKKKIFPFYKNSDLKFVFKKLNEGSDKQVKKAMFVGGCVRKYLLNQDIDDIDIATSLKTDQIKEIFLNTKFKVVDSGIKHGTVTLVSDKLKLELTTLRKDVKTDGRHAEIEYTDNWHEDSNRRDFTINAIYLDINGKIFDPQLGTQDLKNRIIKFIGDPQKRIEEDYLRIIRFIRFSIEFESEIEKSTIEAIKLNLDGIKKISKERTLLELFKILSLNNFSLINKKKQLKEIFLLIFPEFKYLERVYKLNKLPSKIMLDKETLLAILLIDDKKNHEYFLHKYKVSNDLREKLNLFEDNFQNFIKNKKFFQKDLKKNIFYFGKQHLEGLNKINFFINNKMKFNDYLDISNLIKKISIPKFTIDGNYLKNKGVGEGKIIGKILRSLEVEWIKNDFKISEDEISKIIDRAKN